MTDTVVIAICELCVETLLAILRMMVPVSRELKSHISVVTLAQNCVRSMVAMRLTVMLKYTANSNNIFAHLWLVFTCKIVVKLSEVRNVT